MYDYDKVRRREKLELPSQPPELPDWLTVNTPLPSPSPETKKLALAEFEMVFPRVLEMMYSGYSITQALKELPVSIDHGAFIRWVKKDSSRFELFKEAKEIRTEAWAGKIIEHASGEHVVGDDNPEMIQRSKLIVDTYKWLMQADNRKVYGDTKSIEIGGTISIKAALEQAQSRVIDAQFSEVTDTMLLESGDDAEDSL